MAIKRILLPFCDPAGVAPIAETAFMLGRAFSAQVRALFAHPVEGMPLLPDDGMTSEEIMRTIETASREKAARFKLVKEMFDGVARRFEQVDSAFTATEGSVTETVGAAARLADIAVLSAGAHFGAGAWAKVREAAIFGSGRPILLAPRGGIGEDSFDRATIA
jgi:hypothetical protein